MHKNKREDFRQLASLLFVWTTYFGSSCRLQKLFCTDTDFTDQVYSHVERYAYELFMVWAPRALAQQKMPGGWANKWWCLWGRAFASTYKVLTQHLGLKIKLSECPKGPGEVQKTQNAMSNCLFALGPSINVLFTNLGLSIPLNLVDECILMSVDFNIYWQYTFETSHLPPLFDLLPSSDPGHKKF